MHRPGIATLVLLTAALLVPGCDHAAAPCAGSACVSTQTDMYFDERAAYRIDVLVVVDDSPSMASKQSTVQALAARLAEASEKLIRPLDLRFLVVTSSSVPGCSQPVVVPHCAGDRLVRWGQVCGQPPNFAGTLGEAIACASAVGARGCGVEQPLAAMQAALEQKIDPSFPRANGAVFVVIVSDEDDCSTPTGPLPFEAEPGSDDPALSGRCRDADERGQLVPIADYVRLLEMRPLITVSVVATLPAPRLERLAAGLNGRITSLSAEDLSLAFVHYGERLAILLGPPCLPAGIIDREPDRPGLQPECAVTEQVLDEAGRAVDRTLPRCETSAPPCWRVQSADSCTSSGASLIVDRGGCAPPAPATLRTSCLTGPGQ